MTQSLVNWPYEYIPWHLHSLARNETIDLRKHHPLYSRFGFVLRMDVDAENPYNTFIIEEVQKDENGMASPSISSNGQVRQLTKEEGMALLEQEAQRYLKMSAQEFIDAWEQGQFDDHSDQPDVMYLAMLLPFVK